MGYRGRDPLLLLGVGFQLPPPVRPTSNLTGTVGPQFSGSAWMESLCFLECEVALQISLSLSLIFFITLPSIFLVLFYPFPFLFFFFFCPHSFYPCFPIYLFPPFHPSSFQFSVVQFLMLFTSLQIILLFLKF